MDLQHPSFGDSGSGLEDDLSLESIQEIIDALKLVCLDDETSCGSPNYNQAEQRHQDYVACFEQDGHNHKMDKPGFGLDDDSSTYDQKQTNPQESKVLAIQRCVTYLVHACECTDANCRSPSCQKMKRVVQHTNGCSKRTVGCPVCKQLIALCCFHAKHCHCQEAKCVVPFCAKIKNKLRQQQLQQRLQEQQINVPGWDGGDYGPNPSQPAPQMRLRQPASLNVFGNMPNSIGNAPIGSPQVMPNAAGPSLGGMQRSGWQQLLQTLKSPSSPEQQQKVLNIMKSNPQLIAAFIKKRTAKQQRLQHLKVNSKLQEQQINVPGWDSGDYGQNPSQPVPQMRLRQPPSLNVFGNMPNSIGNAPIGSPQVMSNAAGPSIGGMQRPGWQQLLQTLKSPSSPEQQQKVLNIMKSNPQLISAFIKQRIAKQQSQQQGSERERTKMGQMDVSSL